jgi:hypothetical protein
MEMEMKKKWKWKKEKNRKKGGYGVNRGDAVSCPQAPVIVVSYLHSYTYKYIQVPTRHTH